MEITQHLYARTDPKPEPKQAGDSVFSDENESGTSVQLTTNGAFRTVKIPQEELWATAKITGKGRFITTLTPREAYRTDWKYVIKKGSKEPLSEATLDSINKTEREFHIKKIFVAGVSVAKAVGQCIIAKVYTNPLTKAGKIILRIAPYSDMDVEFDEFGLPKSYNVYMKIGHNRAKVKVPASECIALVNEPDPLDNGTIGTSDLLSVYFPIRWSMNVLDGYSRIILQRGLGLLDVEVTGAQPAELAAYETQFGDPTQYSTLFHDEKVKVAVVTGVQQGHNITDTMKIYTREISSGSGIGENRLDGVQTYVTGAETDQDNFAAIGVAIQQDYHDAQVALFKLCNPALPEFAIEMPVEIRMDKLKEAELRATEVRTIMDAPQLFKVKTAMERIGQDAPKGAEGELSVAQFIDSQSDFNEDDPENFDETISDPNSQDEKNEKKDNSQKSQQIPGGKVINVSSVKKARAKELFKTTGDSIPNVRATLINEFGSGISYTDLVAIRAEIDGEKNGK